MEIKITESELREYSNDQELGKMVRKKMLEERIRLESEFVEYDKCVICGKLSPYTKETHIDLRINYIEGGGQGCFQPHICDKI
jgi:hypothetical protein